MTSSIGDRAGDKNGVDTQKNSGCVSHSEDNYSGYSGSGSFSDNDKASVGNDLSTDYFIFEGGD